MGGSDQWGDIVTGTELIRRKEAGEAFALTSPLITKSDGGKFGKTEQGNIWLDAKKTSPYQFYQFWLNTSDADAENFIKIFTLLSKHEIESLITKHAEAPHLRLLQKELAREITIRVHSQDDYIRSVEASEILFGKAGHERLHEIDNDMLLSAFEGVPQFHIALSKFETGINIVELLSVETTIFSSKAESRRMMGEGGLSINKTKVSDLEFIIKSENLIKNKFLIVQKGKKNYYLIICTQ